MRYLSQWICVCALAIAPIVGCSGGADNGGANGGSGGAGGDGTSGKCSSSGVTCDCRPPSPDDLCNRVHVGNFSNQPGIRVVLTVGEQQCTIDELMVDDPGDPGVELDQCVMNVPVGATVRIGASAGIVGATMDCVVGETANVPGLEELQTFADVSAPPLSIACGSGFTM